MRVLSPLRRGGPYANRILGLFGSSIVAYWPLWDAAGPTCQDISGHGYHGGYSGPTLGQEGIGDGRTAPLFDGVNDYVNIYTAGYAAAFNTAEGSIMFWLKVSSGLVWSDATQRRLWGVDVDGSNYSYIFKQTNNNNVTFTYCGSATPKTRVVTLGPNTNWIHVVMTWSKSADEMKVFVNGVQYGATINAIPNFVGTLVSTRFTVDSQSWSGKIAHGISLNRPATPAEILLASKV
jgi:hypothetical protein